MITHYKQRIMAALDIGFKSAKHNYRLEAMVGRGMVCRDGGVGYMVVGVWRRVVRWVVSCGGGG